MCTTRSNSWTYTSGGLSQTPRRRARRSRSGSGTWSRRLAREAKGFYEAWADGVPNYDAANAILDRDDMYTYAKRIAEALREGSLGNTFFSAYEQAYVRKAAEFVIFRDAYNNLDGVFDTLGQLDADEMSLITVV